MEQPYTAVTRFLRQYYAPEENETLAHIAALDGLRQYREQRIALALEMRDLLTDKRIAPTLHHFLSDCAHRDFNTAAEAREFTERVFEANLFDVLSESATQQKSPSDR